jgi:hypothetical protein
MSNPDFRPGSDAEWQELLRQLGSQPQAQPQPFFYTRVQARLSAQRASPLAWLPGWVRRPAYAALLSALVLAVSGDAAALRTDAVASHPSELPSTTPR